MKKNQFYQTATWWQKKSLDYGVRLTEVIELGRMFKEDDLIRAVVIFYYNIRHRIDWEEILVKSPGYYIRRLISEHRLELEHQQQQKQYLSIAIFGVSYHKASVTAKQLINYLVKTGRYKKRWTELKQSKCYQN